MPVSIKILSHIENYAFPDTLLWGKDLEGRYLKSNHWQHFLASNKIGKWRE